jgi:voltage-gated potassium channel Kch
MASEATRGSRWSYRFQEYFKARTERAIVNGRVLPYLAVISLFIAMVAALAICLVDRKEFPNYGDGLWWAVVTLGTVGYGDLVPHNSWGRVVGGLVILFGVTFIAVLTSIVTSHFVTTRQNAQAHRIEEQLGEPARGSSDAMREVAERLRSIEATLDALRRSDGP